MLPAAEIKWTRAGLRSFEELLRVLSAQPYADPVARAREITATVDGLAYSPCRFPAVCVRGDAGFRRIVVQRRYLIYYVYSPSRVHGQPGRVSIRGVKHGASSRPVEGIRRWPPGRFGPRGGAEVALLTFKEVMETLLGAGG